MEIYLDFIASIVGSLAWPLIVLAALIVLRPQISKLLDGLKNLSFGGASASFDAGVVKSDNNISESYEVESIKSNVKIDPQIQSMIEDNPRSAISNSWRYVQRNIDKLAEKYEIEFDRRSLNSAVDQFVDRGIVTEEFGDGLKSLRQTHKRAIRVNDFDLDRASVQHYVKLASEAAQAIEDIVKSRK